MGLRPRRGPLPTRCCWPRTSFLRGLRVPTRSSPLGDAAAVAAVAAALSRSGGSEARRGKRGLLRALFARGRRRGSPRRDAAAAARGPETAEKAAEKGEGREAPALLVLPSPRLGLAKNCKRTTAGGGSRGGAASPRPPPPPLAPLLLLLFPEMLWAPPAEGGKVPRALLAWSRSLAEEAAARRRKEKREEEGEGEKEKEEKEKATTTTTKAKPSSSPLALLTTAAASARVAVARLPACVFARSRAWERARKRKTGGRGALRPTLSVQPVSPERE